ncbi:ABC transporter substrate-binding protein [Paraburkholderia bryophila]|uniref:Amino acid ABC transporter substrate-binding protein (PAAT family) n=1 Tax=Paraburkholderia bryophila TaxID=420952 RepID=A0A329BGH3_9BURK|nr:ABC transporter substrate-binding protein [Paraburkholderia bryophila]RAS20957.1 amino acid ABC transporter substrate-binding protein (PAAT family) [Paraburkholderia bryophila]
MKHSKAIRSAFALWALGVALAASAATPGALDLSPDRHDRIRTAPDAAAIQAVPAAFPFVAKDELVIGMTVAWPPLSTYATDEKTVVGVDPDLAQLVADGLGRKLKIVVLAWEDWPLAVQSGKVDAVLSNVTVTEARKEKFDFSSYRRDVLGFYVRKASPIKAIREPKDIAGLRIITDSGTNQEKILLAWDKENIAHGLKPVQIQYYGDPAVSFVALQSGRADLILSVNSALAYEAAQKGDLRAVGAISGGWPITADLAITTRKGGGLAAPLTLLLNDLIHSGKYTQVLDRWNLGSEAVDKAVTNPPGLPKS